MANKVQSKCLGCGDIFTADVRNRGRQKYCPKRACRAAGKAARQRRWLAKPENRNYFREADNAARVREWQRAHPGYWRNTARHKSRTLQDALRPQVSEPHRESATLALQDALRLQGPVLIGLIAHLSDSTLQDDIAQTSRRLLQLGQDILSGQKPHAPKRVLRPERLRQVPPQFSWIDQRLVRDRHLEHCDVQALALYLVLVTVADAHGLSYYGEASLARLLSMPAASVVQARAHLIRVDLIAYERPLYQVLSLDPPATVRIHGVQSIDRGLAPLRATLAARADRD